MLFLGGGWQTMTSGRNVFVQLSNYEWSLLMTENVQVGEIQILVPVKFYWKQSDTYVFLPGLW